LVTVFAGWSAVSSARRSIGFGRLRAVLHGGSISAEATPAIGAFLGTLQVPAIALTPASSDVLGRTRSEVLV
jgi:hypothetical protein